MLTCVQPRTYPKPPPVALQARYRGRHHQPVPANVSDGHRCLLCSLRRFSVWPKWYIVVICGRFLVALCFSSPSSSRCSCFLISSPRLCVRSSSDQASSIDYIHRSRFPTASESSDPSPVKIWCFMTSASNNVVRGGGMAQTPVTYELQGVPR
jgi:hypothetical protein